MSKPPGSEDTNASTGVASNPTSPSTTDLGRDAAYQSPRPDASEHQEVSPQSPKSFGVELMVDHKLVRALMCQGLRSKYDNTCVLQSHCGTIQNSFRLDSTLADM
jgi:hypothetical protein